MAAQSTTRFIVAFAIANAVLLLMIVLALGIGAVAVPPSEVVLRLMEADNLIWKFRVPRALVGVFAGAGMAISGCLLQLGLRNPLAAPDTVGITAGGGLAAVVALLGAGALPAQALTPVALVGACIGAGLVLVASGKGVNNPIRLALTGVAVSVGLGAVTQLLLVRTAPEAGAAMAWLKGSLYARSLSDAVVVGPIVVTLFCLSLIIAKHFDVLLLDDATMKGIGAVPLRWRLLAVGCAIVSGAAAVAAAGVLAFAGLIVPHLARLLVGPQLLRQLPMATVIGSALVVGSDALGRWMFSPTEIPVGALIAIIGAPYFVFLLMRITSKGT